MPSTPMPPSTKTKSKLRAQEQRRARLEAELRSNLRKRKEQAHERAAPAAPPDPLHGEDGPERQPDAREAANADTRGPTGEAA
jgi:hypothetical protein